MTAFVFANNVSTTLSAAATATATTLSLSSSAGLPTLATGQIMPLTLNDAATGLVYEIVYVTAISGSNVTVERAQEGTGAQSWNTGDYVRCSPTAGTVAAINGNASNPFNVANATASNQAVPLGQVQANFAAINGNASNPFAVSNLTASTGVFSNIQVFTASGTFTVPAGVTKVKATVVGGGGGGAGTNSGYGAGYNGGGSGGAGGAAIGVFSVTPGTAYAVTVGAGGAGGTGASPPTNGTVGGTSSFGSFASATGGGGGINNGGSNAGSAGGAGVGGTLNVPGGYGTDGQGDNFVLGGVGGASLLGGGGRAGDSGGENGQAFGSGGGGAYGPAGNGGSGANGVVILEW